MIYPFQGVWPQIHEMAFVAPSADLIGDVHVGKHSSVWFQVVIRGDVHHIRIGESTNIQDHCTLHVTRKNFPLTIGNEVTLGHRVLLHGCTLENRILIGMGAILLDGVYIESDCLIGAGSLLTSGMRIPAKSLVYGSPARVIRSLREEELLFLKRSAQNYVQDATHYRGVVSGPKRFNQAEEDLDSLEEGDEPSMEGF